MPKYDIVSIGDTTIDAFIELHEASVHCSVNHSDCQLCLSYADKVPYENLTLLPAGNSTNNAVGSVRLGMKNAFITGLGDDMQGQIIIDELKKGRHRYSIYTQEQGSEDKFSFCVVISR